jgi:hypothetical protein
MVGNFAQNFHILLFFGLLHQLSVAEISYTFCHSIVATGNAALSARD